MTGGERMVGPGELAERLGVLPPTPEQAEVIEAPLDPMVVVAGAGSGKSETMAGRVVWLVANGLVRPERVLGLTFTRKAAAELASRVRKRLARLAEVGLVPPEMLDTEPTVSTYHAYAARLVTDHALREAMEPTMRLVSPAVSWQMAARVVGQYDGPMDQVELGPPSVTAAVLELAGELAEHLRSAADVRSVGAWLSERLAEVTGRVTLAQRKPLRTHATREQLLPMVEAYTRLKRSREVIDYGDQMALAARIAARHAEVGAIERGRFSVVLLDEYQDTSHAQLVLLRALFGGGHPVTAVGDPCQSIYGWRGASAGNLRRFVGDFPAADGAPASVRRLSISFRNGERVLDVAASIQVPLRREATEVPVLKPGDNRRMRGLVVSAFHETAEDEATWIAQGVAGVLGGQVAPDGLPWSEGEREKPKTGAWGGPQAVQPQDIAILARKRSQFPALRRALEARDIPVEVVGLGGLLTVPEVADIVATLRVLYDPTAGDALVRLLAGARWRIGPPDLKILGDRARELNRESRHGPVAADPLEQAVTDLAAERGSLIDALDELLDRAEWLAGFSAPAQERLPAMAHELRVLRAHTGQPLPDLITEIERRLGLDIEVAARGGGPLAARADLDAFLDAAVRFAGDAEDPTLGAFLAYLKAAETEEFGLEAGRVGETNSVKLMTVHASKGLEWPVVIVPGLSQLTTQKGGLAKGSVFPATPVTNSRWTENPRKLPYSLRGDRSDLPELAGLAKDDLESFDERCRERDLMEERRLAYVAVTRAHYLLIASGYRWGTSSKPLEPSDFLLEIREACGGAALWAPDLEEGAENPLLAEPATASWPLSPGGERHEAVLDGARMVEEALANEPDLPPPPPTLQPAPTHLKPASAADTAPQNHNLAPSPPDALGDEMDPDWLSVFSSPEAFGDGTDTEWPGVSASPEALGDGMDPEWLHAPASPEVLGDGTDPEWLHAPASPEVLGDGTDPEWLHTSASPVALGDGMDQGSLDVSARLDLAGVAGVAGVANVADVADVAGGAELREWELERLRGWSRDTELLLRERGRLRRRGGGDVELPAHLSVSSLVTLAADPGALARQIRRPVPKRPAPLARRGTSFHRWLESRWGQQRLIDDVELLGMSDEFVDADVQLAELQARFEESRWAALRPMDQEVPFEATIGDQLVRGRMDAVFREGDGYVVVDWKTGEPPRGDAARAASVQLAAYRLAWADLAGVPLEQVGAAFHYVRSNETVRPVDLLDARGLAALIETVPLIDGIS